MTGRSTVIKFGGLPSKHISLLLTGYNLKDWLSPLLLLYCFHKNINNDEI